MRPAPKSPCEGCKRKPNCPTVCYPMRDWERNQKKKKRREAARPNGTMFIGGRPVAGCFVYTKKDLDRVEVAVRDRPMEGEC